MQSYKSFLLKQAKQLLAVLLSLLRFLALALAPHYSHVISRLPVTEKDRKRYQGTQSFIESALARTSDSPRKRFQWLMRRQHCHACLGYPDKAADDLRQALRLRPGNFRAHQCLANLMKRVGPAWQWLEAVRAFVNAYPTRAYLWAELGLALLTMNRFGEAARAYERALALKPGKAKQSEWLYQAGVAYERNGQTVEASEKYTKALALTIPEADRALGPGLLHAKHKNWAAAAKAYQAVLAGGTDNPGLRLHLGEALCRRMRWDEAAEAYRPLFAQSPSAIPPEHLKLYALALERAGQLEDAARVYRFLIQATGWKDSQYRLGCVLHDLNRPQETVDAFLHCLDGASLEPEIKLRPTEAAALEEALAEDQTKAENHYKLGCYYEAKGDWAQASEAYQKAADRKEQHEPVVYYRLGLALERQGLFDEAATAFRDTRRIHKTATLATVPKGNFFDKTMGYLAAWEYCPLRKKVILYESFDGRNMTDNPYALFRYLLDNPDYADWLHVWALREKGTMPPEYRKRPNVVFAKHGSSLYWRHLATAGWLVNNTAFRPECIRRPGQKYLNTWHGTPLKVLGKDVAGDYLHHAAAGRYLLQATHLINPNQHTRDIILKTAEVDEIISAREAITGYPRIDLMLNATEERKKELRRQIGLQEGQPVVLYAPTWRAEAGQARDLQFDRQRVCEFFAALSGLEAQIVFRGHSVIKDLIGKLPIKNAGAHIDASELLAITDILITDYSSIFFDFLPMQRPILFYAYDLEDYCARRGGLYFKLEDMPGVLCRTVEELKIALKRALREEYAPDQKHLDALARFCPHEDGRASQRVANFFFKDIPPPVKNQKTVTPRQNVLLYAGGFLPNGITASFLNLSKNLDREKYRLILALDDAGRNLEKYPERQTKFEEYDRGGMQLVVRRNNRLFALEEKLAEDLTERDPEHALEPEIQKFLRQHYAREFRRVFGEARFDVLINFIGYSPFWTPLLAHAPAPARRAIYLHNDMMEERRIRFPHLEKVFQAYGAYDVLACVSPGCRESNLQNLAPVYGLAPKKFVVARNLINDADILTKATAPLPEDLAAFIGDAVLFLALGRLSPEKDHAKLLRAFTSVVEAYPQVKLLILGEGPLRQFLESLILELGLGSEARLGGFLENPYPVLRRADCLVQSSNHEGQPMTFLEAMVLQRPIISTDLPSTRYVLKNNYGLLVENSQAGLEAGLRQFLEQGLPVRHFDADSYNRECLAEFERLINGPDN